MNNKHCTEKISIRQAAIITLISVVSAAILIVLNLPRITYNISGDFSYETGVTAKGEPFKGSPKAPVTMILYSDFVCIHCGDFADAIEELSKEYIETGKLSIIFRNYAHYSDESPLAAAAADCALDLGADKFWKYHDVIIVNRGRGPKAYSRDALISYAVMIGIDSVKFSKCLKSNMKTVKILNEYNKAEEINISGTPTWFLNGRKFKGAYTPAKLRETLDFFLDNIEK